MTKRLEEIEGRLMAFEATALHKSRWQIEQEDEVLGRNAPADLRYLLDFAKAAREALVTVHGMVRKLCLDWCVVDQPCEFCQIQRITREALALLETP